MITYFTADVECKAENCTREAVETENMVVKIATAVLPTAKTLILLLQLLL